MFTSLSHKNWWFMRDWHLAAKFKSKRSWIWTKSNTLSDFEETSILFPCFPAALQVIEPVVSALCCGQKPRPSRRASPGELGLGQGLTAVGWNPSQRRPAAYLPTGLQWHTQKHLNWQQLLTVRSEIWLKCFFQLTEWWLSVLIHDVIVILLHLIHFDSKINYWLSLWPYGSGYTYLGVQSFLGGSCQRCCVYCGHVLFFASGFQLDGQASEGPVLSTRWSTALASW